MSLIIPHSPQSISPTSLYSIAISSTHGWLLKHPDLHLCGGVGVHVIALTLATLSKYAGIPTILGRHKI